ncbi:MAG: hypothetical protein R2843_13275 [Thermomicrobiales bacterium]
MTGTSAYIDPHPLISRNFLTGGTGNTMNYSNPDVDALIEQGMIEMISKRALRSIARSSSTSSTICRGCRSSLPTSSKR